IVLADRYVFTALARAVVRGADRDWIRSVFGFALVPDLTLYLKIDVDSLIPRVLQSRRMDYWEAGMDMHPDADLYESFRRYQGRLIREYQRMAREFGFATIDARLPVEAIQSRMRARVQMLLQERKEESPEERLRVVRSLPSPEPGIFRARENLR